ncbi:MAG: hypothetical protein QY332_13190 [Anaerolineales bacterium]|nr:MAG: hypothetical protein QY332_13190 [Anaerolineales bacterium]
MKRKILVLFVALGLLLSACGGGQPTQDVDAIVQATFQALTAQAPLQTSTPEAMAEEPPAQLGGIAGQLGYPSSFIPSMVVVAYEIGGSNYYYVITNDNASTYQIDNLPSGTYYVVAYPDPSYPGGYSQAVPCGLSVDCTDHSLIPVTVTGGQVTQGANPTDFYAPEGTFPPYPLP